MTLQVLQLRAGDRYDEGEAPAAAAVGALFEYCRPTQSWTGWPATALIISELATQAARSSADTQAVTQSHGRDGRQQADADGQHQKAEQEKCHLGHKASEGKGTTGMSGWRHCPLRGVFDTDADSKEKTVSDGPATAR